MRQSRRSFLDVLSGGRDSRPRRGSCHRALDRRARPRRVPGASRAGHGSARRPELPPGVKAIRISSNENPLGPGKAALDAIVGKFPEAGRYPFNSTPADSALVDGDRDEVHRQARERRPRRRVAGNSQERGARVHVADARAGHRVADVRELPGHRAAARASGHRGQGRLRRSASTSTAWPRRPSGAGLVFLNNPNNPTATVHGARPSPTSSSASARRRPTR